MSVEAKKIYDAYALEQALERYRATREDKYLLSCDDRAQQLACARENLRFEENNYFLLGLNFDSIKDHLTPKNRERAAQYGEDVTPLFSKEGHYLHASTSEKGMIAYTPDKEKLVADRQTKTRFGRYLTQFHADWLNATEIAAISNVYSNRFVDTSCLKWARTRDEIAHVYKNGPSSCMGGKADNHFICGPVHPTEAYASGDFAVAYLEEDKRITSRVVVDCVNNEYVRIYGNEAVTDRILKVLNFKKANEFKNGLRLLRIPFKSTFIGPYIDGTAREIYEKKDDKMYLYYGSTTESSSARTKMGFTSVGHSHRSNDTRGLFNVAKEVKPMTRCACCSREVEIETVIEVTEDRLVCPVCIADRYVHASRATRTGRVWVLKNQAVLAADGRAFESKAAAEYHGYRFLADDKSWTHENQLMLDGHSGNWIRSSQAIHAILPNGRQIVTYHRNAFYHRESGSYRVNGETYESNVQETA